MSDGKSEVLQGTLDLIEDAVCDGAATRVRDCAADRAG
jgi:hypothetical protein